MNEVMPPKKKLRTLPIDMDEFDLPLPSENPGILQKGIYRNWIGYESDD